MPPGRRKQWAQLAASFFLGGLLVYVVQRPAALHADSALLQEGVPKVASAAVPSGTTPATTTAAAASPSSARAGATRGQGLKPLETLATTRW
jgi:hypothetical protein